MYLHIPQYMELALVLAIGANIAAKSFSFMLLVARLKAMLTTLSAAQS